MIRLKPLLIVISLNFNLVLSTCPSTFFDCGNDRCIAHFWRCDGEDDCGNWADEHNCKNGLDVKQVKECPMNHIHCHDVYDTCVPNKWVCDGMEDCGNGSDEWNCTAEIAQCVGFLCENFDCIPSRWRCDGIADCDDSSDEHNCTHTKKNHICDKEHGFYQCITGECISHNKVCDNRKDCPQGDDEGMECKPNGCHQKNCSQLCFVAPHGPECYCREGYEISSDNVTCVDKNECESNKMDGYCSQRCINLDGSYRCSCFEDYELVNNKSCVVKEGEPLLLFSNSEGIRGLYLKTGRFFPVYHSLTQTVGIDMLGSEQKVFWVDLAKHHSGVHSVDLNGDNHEAIVTTGLESPEDIAVDWIGENFYITDAGLNKIIVCHLDGSICATLLSNGIDLPRAIVVDPHRGILFWTEWGKFPGVYQAGMDGSDPSNLIKDNLVWPNGLAFDSVLNRLYWSEAKYGAIEFYDFDTKQRKAVFKDTVFHPFSLSVFEDNLYWSDWNTFSLEKGNKMTGHNQTVITREINEHIMGVHIYHPLMQKSSYNPCWLHMCSHLCLLAPSRKYSCVCPDHMMLGKDNQTCVPISNNPYLFIAVDKYVKKIYSESIGNDVMLSVRVPSGIKVGDIAFNWKTQTLYVFDLNKLAIGSMGLQNPIESYFTPIVDTELEKVEGLAYDANTNNLYWLELKEGILEVATADGKARTVLMEDLDRPIDLVLFPEHRRMYVAVMGSKPHIMVADMDGQNPKVLIASKNGLPVSLALDRSHQKLFWADAKNGIIEWMDLFAPKDSDSHRGVVRRHLGHVMSIEIYNHSIYWTDMDSEFIYHEDYEEQNPKVSKIALHVHLKGSGEKKLLMAQPEEGPPGPCAEANGGCSHICLIGRFGVTCKCPLGHHLLDDGQTCSKINDMTDNSLLHGHAVGSGHDFDHDFDHDSNHDSDHDSSHNDFEHELGFLPFEDDEEEDLNWFKDIDEDEEADILFARHDSKHRVMNTSNVDDNPTDRSTDRPTYKPTDKPTERSTSKVTVRPTYRTTSKSLENQTKQSKNKESEKVVDKSKQTKVNQKKVKVDQKVDQIVPTTSDTNLDRNLVRIESVESGEEVGAASEHRGWISLFVAVLIIAIIVLIIFVIIRKDDYREVRNVIYKKGDQIRGAIVSFQNPVFRKQFRQNDEEEPLNIENDDKY